MRKVLSVAVHERSMSIFFVFNFILGFFYTFFLKGRVEDLMRKVLGVAVHESSMSKLLLWKHDRYKHRLQKHQQQKEVCF